MAGIRIQCNKYNLIRFCRFCLKTLQNRSFAPKKVNGCKVSPLVWSNFIGQNADLTSGSDCTENPGYSDIPHTVTLFGRPNTVSVSGEACAIYLIFLAPIQVTESCLFMVFHQVVNYILLTSNWELCFSIRRLHRFPSHRSPYSVMFPFVSCECREGSR